jgi:hypothetical protein
MYFPFVASGRELEAERLKDIPGNHFAEIFNI